jgi:hypothetical protein
MYRVIAHPVDGEPIVGDVDELPPAGASFILINHPFKRNGDYVEWLDEDSVTLLLSLARVAFVEFSSERTGQELVRRWDRNRGGGSYGASQP